MTDISPEHPRAQDLFEAQRSRVLGELEALFAAAELADLPQVCEDLEELLTNFSLLALLDHAPRALGCCKHPEGQYLLDEHGAFYELFIGDDPLKRDTATLLVVLNPRSAKVPRPPSRPRTWPISGYGRYRKVTLYLPRDGPTSDHAFALQLITTIFETGYAWVRQHFQRLVEAAEATLGRVLYDHIASLIPTDELRRNLWFATITKGYGFRLLERNVAREAFPLIHRHSPRLGHSTNRLVAELLSTRLPEHELLMRIAASEKHCIDVDLSNAGYTKRGSIYTTTLISLYGSESFTIYPILVSDKINVFALFSTVDRQAIEPRLRAHHQELEELCRQSTKLIRRAERLFVPNVSPTVLDSLVLELKFPFGLGINLRPLAERLLRWGRSGQFGLRRSIRK